MRLLALAALLAACAGPKPAAPSPAAAPPAIEANQGPYRIPDRFNLPGNNKEAPAQYDAALLTVSGPRLVELLQDPKEVLREQVVLTLVARMDQTERGKKVKYSWEPNASALAALDVLFAEEPPSAFRRWAVFNLFSSAAAEVRGRITLDGADKETDLWWAKTGELRDRGLRDKDPYLAEYFERFAEDPEAANWRETKKAAVAARDRMLAERPEYKPVYADVWRLLESIESAQLTVLARLTKHIQGQKGVPAARREQLKSVERGWVEHRLRISWANMLPRIVVEALDAAEAKSYGFVPVPVKNGWPAIPPR